MTAADTSLTADMRTALRAMLADPKRGGVFSRRTDQHGGIATATGLAMERRGLIRCITSRPTLAVLTDDGVAAARRLSGEETIGS